MKLLNIIIILVFTTFLLNSCKQAENKGTGQISTEVVNNPISANGNNNIEKLPKFQFANKIHDFGVIIEGEKVSYTFKYKNAGKSDLVISSASGSCGCTVPKFSREPLASGQEGYIEVIFDSSGKNGMQSKTITLMANTQPNSEVLTITGEVVKNKD